MTVSGLAPQPTPQQTPQSPAAAIAMLRASLEAMAQKLGQTFPATVLGTDGNGLTQLRLGDLTLAVKLSQPLPAGTRVQITVQPAVDGTIALAVQPRVATPLPVAAMPPPPVNAAVTMQAQAPAPVAQLPVPAAAPAAAATAPTVPTTSMPPATAPLAPPVPASVPIAGQPAAQPATLSPAPQVAPATVAQSSSTPVASPPMVTLTTAPAPVPGAPTASSAPVAAASTSPALPTVALPASPGPSAAGPSATVATVSPATSPALTAVTAQPAPVVSIAAPAATKSVVTALVTTPTPATPATPAPASSPAPHTALTPAPQPVPATRPEASVTGFARSAAMPVADVLPRTLPSGPPVSPATAAIRPAAMPMLPLNQPAQLAAQQDSIVPLLKNLAVLGDRLQQMPVPLAAAAARLLASPVVAERRLPAEVLKAAVERAGVLLDPPARAGSAPINVKSSLLQLRAGLLALLEGSDIAPALAAGRRPAPPLPDAQPRGMRPDGPTLNADAAPRDAARTLLHQTDGALSRLKLTQLASQPADAAIRAGAAAPDFMVELPMVLGSELGLLQLRVQRDGKGRTKPGERGWRVRFAVSFSAIGEVGAQVALLGRTTNVTVWADRETTAAALEEMLPELGPALAARGLTVGAVRLRRAVPGDDTRPGSGRLMDTVT